MAGPGLISYIEDALHSYFHEFLALQIFPWTFFDHEYNINQSLKNRVIYSPAVFGGFQGVANFKAEKHLTLAGLAKFH